MTVTNASGVDYYDPVVVSAQDYYAFGMMMPERTYSAPSSSYRYGFNGKENDGDVKGEGNQIDFGVRIYDPRISRFLSVDPLSRKFPWETPYAFAENEPVNNVDLEGLQKGGNRYAEIRTARAAVSRQKVSQTFQRKQTTFSNGSKFIKPSIYNSTVIRNSPYQPPPPGNREQGVIGPFILRDLSGPNAGRVEMFNSLADLWENRESVVRTIRGAIIILTTEHTQQTTGQFASSITKPVITSVSFVDAGAQRAFDMLQGQYEQKYAEIESRYAPTPLNAPYADPKCLMCVVSPENATEEMKQQRIKDNQNKALQKGLQLIFLGKSPKELLLDQVSTSNGEFKVETQKTELPTISQGN